MTENRTLKADDFESRLAAAAAAVAQSCPAYFLTDQDRVVGHRGELKRLRPRRRPRRPPRHGPGRVIPLVRATRP